MRTALLSIPLLLAAAPALAQTLPNSLTMSCAATRALVQKNGQAVIATGPNIYELFVVNVSYCLPSQTTRPAWVETADEAQCLVGRRCVDRQIRIRR